MGMSREHLGSSKQFHRRTTIRIKYKKTGEILGTGFSGAVHLGLDKEGRKDRIRRKFGCINPTHLWTNLYDPGKQQKAHLHQCPPFLDTYGDSG